MLSGFCTSPWVFGVLSQGFTTSRAMMSTTSTAAASTGLSQLTPSELSETPIERVLFRLCLRSAGFIGRSGSAFKALFLSRLKSLFPSEVFAPVLSVLASDLSLPSLVSCGCSFAVLAPFTASAAAGTAVLMAPPFFFTMSNAAAAAMARLGALRP